MAGGRKTRLRSVTRAEKTTLFYDTRAKNTFSIRVRPSVLQLLDCVLKMGFVGVEFFVALLCVSECVSE